MLPCNILIRNVLSHQTTGRHVLQTEFFRHRSGNLKYHVVAVVVVAAAAVVVVVVIIVVVVIVVVVLVVVVAVVVVIGSQKILKRYSDSLRVRRR